MPPKQDLAITSSDIISHLWREFFRKLAGIAAYKNICGAGRDSVFEEGWKLDLKQFEGYTPGPYEVRSFSGGYDEDGEYYLGHIEIRTMAIEMGGHEYNPETKKFDLPVYRPVCETAFDDRKTINGNPNRYYRAEEELATMRLLAAAPDLLEEVRRLRTENVKLTMSAEIDGRALASH